MFNGSLAMFTHTNTIDSAIASNEHIDMTSFPVALQRLHEKFKTNSDLTENEKLVYANIQIIEDVRKDPAKRVLLTPTMRYFYEKAMGNTDLIDIEKSALSYIQSISTHRHFCEADTYIFLNYIKLYLEYQDRHLAVVLVVKPSGVYLNFHMKTMLYTRLKNYFLR